jgi:pimeloyl-ACP methyl ester carboxylesterase
MRAWGNTYHRDDAGDLMRVMDAMELDAAHVVGISDGATIALTAGFHLESAH